MPRHPRTIARELRDQIYSYLTAETGPFLESPDPEDDAKVEISLSSVVLLTVLLVCTQIHDDYLESMVLKMEANVYYGNTAVSSIPAPINLTPVQAKVLKQLKLCTIHFHWLHFVPEETISQLLDSIDDGATAAENRQVAIAGADEFYRRVDLLLHDVVLPLLHQDAQLVLRVDFSQSEDSEEPENERWLWADARRYFLPEITRTWLEDSKDESLAPIPAVWEPYVKTPLYCTMPTNYAEMAANRAAFANGTTDWFVKPLSEASAERGCWELVFPEGLADYVVAGGSVAWSDEAANGWSTWFGFDVVEWRPDRSGV